MTVVFDACTPILLAKAGLLERFIDASAAKAVVPRAVEREACDGKPSADALEIRRLIERGKIDVQSVIEKAAVKKVRGALGLGVGEAETVALAMAIEADLVATDDRRGIEACKLMRVAFTSAPAILIRMREKGVLDRDEAWLKLALLEREGRYRKDLIADVRARLEVI